MITGSGTTSLRKRELENQRIPAVGFVKQFFAHKASAGATGINLTSLTTPPEMSANGFTNPTTAQLSSANLLFFKNNLTIVSSARGPLQQTLSYSVASSTQINFIGFTALENEIFTGIIDYSVISGIKVVDATAQPATGTLAAGTTDFNTGQFFLTNKYSSSQLGSCSVYLDGALQVRNTANSSVTLDANYYEVDNGSGSFSVIRFNVSDPVNIRNVVVIPTGLLSERPDGSMMTVIESVNGKLQNMAGYVATLASQTTATILGGAPSNVDLKSFGDRVLTLEQTRATTATVSVSAAGLVPASNTSLDNGSATRLGLMQYLHGTTYNGGLAPTVTSTKAGFSVTRALFIPYQMNDGTWRLKFNLRATFTSAAMTTWDFSINGVTFNFGQALTAADDGGTAQFAFNTLTSSGTGTANSYFPSSTHDRLMTYGDVELSSKPTWAY